MTSNTDRWSDSQIKQHKTAANLLCKIMDETFEFIRQNYDVTEYETQQFIVNKYKENNLVSDTDPPIVAFRENTSFVHYFPEQETAKKLENDSLIMIDIWARLDEPNAPYADITWMAWHGGDIPADIQTGLDVIFASRDSCISYIQKSLSEKKELICDDLCIAMTDIVRPSKLQKFMPHSYGHSLGTSACHGDSTIYGSLLQNNNIPVCQRVAYTIEPGTYIEGQYGFRTEIDFLIDKNGKLDLTTVVQREVVRV